MTEIAALQQAEDSKAESEIIRRTKNLESFESWLKSKLEQSTKEEQKRKDQMVEPVNEVERAKLRDESFRNWLKKKDAIEQEKNYSQFEMGPNYHRYPNTTQRRTSDDMKHKDMMLTMKRNLVQRLHDTQPHDSKVLVDQDLAGWNH